MTDLTFSVVFQSAATVKSHGGSDFCSQHHLPSPLPQWLRQASYKASQIPTEIAQVSAGKEKGNNSSGLSEYCFLFHLGEHLKDMPKLSLSGKVILYADLT